jgi:peptidoglycan/LPS O-acetylase OafA/YrhL
MRGLAVLAVVAFHAWPRIARGDYVGVDVFFILSGYLISSIIFEGLEKNAFDFKTFYVRRVRRIFPALVVVVRDLRVDLTPLPALCPDGKVKGAPG